MKKIMMIGLVGMIAATSANAGFWDSLGFGKKSEPTTLAEACDKDEITKVCPETLLGNKTLMECLSENVSQLSGKCTSFVKQSINKKTDEMKNTAAAAKAKAVEAKATAKGDNTELKKQAKDAAVKTVDDATGGAVTAAKDTKAAAKQTHKEVKETGKELKETGKALKGMF